MKYVKAENEKPRTGVDVIVVTNTGIKGIARYWDLTNRWITNDKNINKFDKVIKWKYADAKVV